MIDSYDHSTADHRKCFELVFDAIDNGEAEACFGNHELSYLIDRHRCSGWDRDRAALMDDLAIDIHKRFKPAILLRKDFLVSHGGLTNQLWEKEGLTLETLPMWLGEAWIDLNSSMHYIGKCRGGWHPFGGLFWATFREDFRPVSGLTQVFGHTRQRDGMQVEYSQDVQPTGALTCWTFIETNFLNWNLIS